MMSLISDDVTHHWWRHWSLMSLIFDDVADIWWRRWSFMNIMYCFTDVRSLCVTPHHCVCDRWGRTWFTSWWRPMSRWQKRRAWLKTPASSSRSWRSEWMENHKQQENTLYHVSQHSAVQEYNVPLYMCLCRQVILEYKICLYLKCVFIINICKCFLLQWVGTILWFCAFRTTMWGSS